MDEFSSPQDCTRFDIYILGPAPRVPVKTGVTPGFTGRNLTLDEARHLVDMYRQQWIAVRVVPVEYRDRPYISSSQAEHIAAEAFERTKQVSQDRFGELKPGFDVIGWFEFRASNLTAQDAGYHPGMWRTYVDKVLGRELTTEEEEWVERLTYG
jgi:hypothetical protein